jgi:hypothetical protein
MSIVADCLSISSHEDVPSLSSPQPRLMLQLSISGMERVVCYWSRLRTERWPWKLRISISCGIHSGNSLVRPPPIHYNCLVDEQHTLRIMASISMARYDFNSKSSTTRWQSRTANDILSSHRRQFRALFFRFVPSLEYMRQSPQQHGEDMCFFSDSACKLKAIVILLIQTVMHKAQPHHVFTKGVGLLRTTRLKNCCCIPFLSIL